MNITLRLFGTGTSFGKQMMWLRAMLSLLQYIQLWDRLIQERAYRHSSQFIAFIIVLPAYYLKKIKFFSFTFFLWISDSCRESSDDRSTDGSPTAIEFIYWEFLHWWFKMTKRKFFIILSHLLMITKILIKIYHEQKCEI